MLNRYLTLSCVVCVCWAVVLTGPALLVALAAVVGAVAVGMMALMFTGRKSSPEGELIDTDGRAYLLLTGTLPIGCQHVQAPPVVALSEGIAQICAPSPKRVRKSAAKVTPKTVKAPRKPSPRAAAKASRPAATAPKIRKRSVKAPE